MSTFEGKVYDLDFIDGNGACQALITDGTIPNLVVFTSEPRMQTILETAMILDKNVVVEFNDSDPKVLTRVKLNVSQVPG